MYDNYWAEENRMRLRIRLRCGFFEFKAAYLGGADGIVRLFFFS